MLTTATVGDVAGINGVEWDAVELPSQFMENWCYDRACLFGFAKHWKTGEAMPEEMFKKLCDQKTYNAGMAMTRQLVRLNLGTNCLFTSGIESTFCGLLTLKPFASSCFSTLGSLIWPFIPRLIQRRVNQGKESRSLTCRRESRQSTHRTICRFRKIGFSAAFAISSPGATRQDTSPINGRK